MFENYRKLVFLWLLLFVSAGAQADSMAVFSATEKRDQDIRQLMKVTGVDDFLIQMPDLVEAGLFMWVQSQQGVAKDQIDKVKELISKFFSHAYFKRELSKYFKTKYDGLRFEKIVRLFRTPLSQQMTLLENELRTKRGMEALQQYPNYLDKHSPTPERAQLVAKLNEASHSSEVILTTQLHILKNVLLVASSLANDESSLSLTQINSILDTVNAQIGQQVLELVIVTFLFTYKDASDINLQNYVEFYNNESLKWYFTLYLQGLNSVFANIPSELSLLLNAH